MSALLIYSNKCKNCAEVIQFIHSKPQLQPVVKYHDVNQLGVPNQYRNKIKGVPVLLTKNGKLLNGKQEIVTWLQSLLPCSVSHQSFSVGKGLGMSLLSGGEDDTHFNLSEYGQPLQPAMTPELEAKISKDVAADNSTYT